MWGEGSPALLRQGHLSHPWGDAEPGSDAASPGSRGVGTGEHSRALPAQELQHQLPASNSHCLLSTTSQYSCPLRGLGRVSSYSLCACWIENHRILDWFRLKGP